MKIKLGKLLRRLFSRDVADTIQTGATMAGRPDIAAGDQAIEDGVDAVKGNKKKSRGP